MKSKMKRIIIIIIGTMVSFVSYAQVNQSVKSLYSYNTTDTTSLQVNRSSLQTNYGNTGALYFDKVRNKWRVWNGTAYVDLISTTSTNHALPFATPEQYGAVGNGVTNDAVALQACINSGKTCLLAEKNYRTTANINVPVSGRIKGCGYNSFISINTGITILTLNGYAYLDNFTLAGSDAASQIGVRVSDAVAATSTKVNNHLTNVNFIDLNYGLNAATVFGARYQGAYHAVNCFFDSNNFAIYLEAEAEYNTFANCVVTGNKTGARFDGGNNNMTGGHFTANTTAINLNNIANSGKVVMSNIQLNHNTTAITATSITNTSSFDNIFIFGGRLTFNGSSIRLNNCVFSDGAPTTWTMANSTETVEFNDCKFLYNPTITTSGNASRFFNCIFTTGTVPSYAASNFQTPLSTTYSTTLAGFEVGSGASDPSGGNNGGIFYRSDIHKLRAKINSVWTSIGIGDGNLSGTLTTNRVPFASGVNTLTDDAGMTYSSGTDALTLGATQYNGGANAIQFSSSPLTINNTSTSAQNVFGAGFASNASTNIVEPVIRLYNNSTGIPAVGFGVGIDFESQNTLTSEKIGDLNFAYTSMTANNEHVDIKLNAMTFGTVRQFVKFDGTSLELNDVNNDKTYLNSGGIGNVMTNGSTSFIVSLAGGGTSTPDGQDFVVTPGNANVNGDGGSISLNSGNGSGTGKNGTIMIQSGTNRNLVTATLVAGSVTISSNIVTANTMIITTYKKLGGVTGFLYVSSRVPGTSFSIGSSSITDTSVIQCLLIEPN